MEKFSHRLVSVGRAFQSCLACTYSIFLVYQTHKLKNNTGCRCTPRAGGGLCPWLRDNLLVLGWVCLCRLFSYALEFLPKTSLV